MPTSIQIIKKAKTTYNIFLLIISHLSKAGIKVNRGHYTQDTNGFFPKCILRDLLPKQIWVDKRFDVSPTPLLYPSSFTK